MACNFYEINIFHSMFALGLNINVQFLILAATCSFAGSIVEITLCIKQVHLRGFILGAWHCILKTRWMKGGVYINT